MTSNNYSRFDSESPTSEGGGIDTSTFNKYLSEVSNGILGFSELIRSINQKRSLIGSSSDSRRNHQLLSEAVDQGQKLSSQLKQRLRSLTRATSSRRFSSKKPQVKKLTDDYKNQLRQFDKACQEYLTNEKKAIDYIRTTSSRASFDSPAASNNNTNLRATYNEDHIYADANIVEYNEDDLAAREEDLLRINNQLQQVNAAYREIDGLIQDQEETVVEIADNADLANKYVADGLEQVQQADVKESYCNCSKKKLCIYGFVGIFIVILAISLVIGVRG